MFFLPYIVFNSNINDNEIIPLKVHDFMWLMNQQHASLFHLNHITTFFRGR